MRHPEPGALTVSAFLGVPSRSSWTTLHVPDCFACLPLVPSPVYYAVKPLWDLLADRLKPSDWELVGPAEMTVPKGRFPDPRVVCLTLQQTTPMSTTSRPIKVDIVFDLPGSGFGPGFDLNNISVTSRGPAAEGLETLDLVLLHPRLAPYPLSPSLPTLAAKYGALFTASAVDDNTLPMALKGKRVLTLALGLKEAMPHPSTAKFNDKHQRRVAASPFTFKAVPFFNTVSAIATAIVDRPELLGPSAQPVLTSFVAPTPASSAYAGAAAFAAKLALEAPSPGPALGSPTSDSDTGEADISVVLVSRRLPGTLCVQPVRTKCPSPSFEAFKTSGGQSPGYGRLLWLRPRRTNDSTTTASVAKVPQLVKDLGFHAVRQVVFALTVKDDLANVCVAVSRASPEFKTAFSARFVVVVQSGLLGAFALGRLCRPQLLSTETLSLARRTLGPDGYADLSLESHLHHLPGAYTPYYTDTAGDPPPPSKTRTSASAPSDALKPTTTSAWTRDIKSSLTAVFHNAGADLKKTYRSLLSAALTSVCNYVEAARRATPSPDDPDPGLLPEAELVRAVEDVEALYEFACVEGEARLEGRLATRIEGDIFHPYLRPRIRLALKRCQFMWTWGVHLWGTTASDITNTFVLYHLLSGQTHTLTRKSKNEVDAYMATARKQGLDIDTTDTQGHAREVFHTWAQTRDRPRASGLTSLKELLSFKMAKAAIVAEFGPTATPSIPSGTGDLVNGVANAYAIDLLTAEKNLAGDVFLGHASIMLCSLLLVVPKDAKRLLLQHPASLVLAVEAQLDGVLPSTSGDSAPVIAFLKSVRAMLYSVLDQLKALHASLTAGTAPASALAAAASELLPEVLAMHMYKKARSQSIVPSPSLTSGALRSRLRPERAGGPARRMDLMPDSPTSGGQSSRPPLLKAPLKAPRLAARVFSLSDDVAKELEKKYTKALDGVVESGHASEGQRKDLVRRQARRQLHEVRQQQLLMPQSQPNHVVSGLGVVLFAYWGSRLVQGSFSVELVKDAQAEDVVDDADAADHQGHQPDEAEAACDASDDVNLQGAKSVPCVWVAKRFMALAVNSAGRELLSVKDPNWRSNSWSRASSVVEAALTNAGVPVPASSSSSSSASSAPSLLVEAATATSLSARVSAGAGTAAIAGTALDTVESGVDGPGVDGALDESDVDVLVHPKPKSGRAVPVEVSLLAPLCLGLTARAACLSHLTPIEVLGQFVVPGFLAEFGFETAPAEEEEEGKEDTSDPSPGTPSEWRRVSVLPLAGTTPTKTLGDRSRLKLLPDEVHVTMTCAVSENMAPNRLSHPGPSGYSKRRADRRPEEHPFASVGHPIYRRPVLSHGKLHDKPSRLVGRRRRRRRRYRGPSLAGVTPATARSTDSGSGSVSGSDSDSSPDCDSSPDSVSSGSPNVVRVALDSLALDVVPVDDRRDDGAFAGLAGGPLLAVSAIDFDVPSPSHDQSDQSHTLHHSTVLHAVGIGVEESKLDATPGDSTVQTGDPTAPMCPGEPRQTGLVKPRPVAAPSFKPSILPAGPAPGAVGALQAVQGGTSGAVPGARGTPGAPTSIKLRLWVSKGRHARGPSRGHAVRDAHVKPKSEWKAPHRARARDRLGKPPRIHLWSERNICAGGAAKHPSVRADVSLNTKYLTLGDAQAMPLPPFGAKASPDHAFVEVLASAFPDRFPDVDSCAAVQFCSHCYEHCRFIWLEHVTSPFASLDDTPAPAPSDGASGGAGTAGPAGGAACAGPAGRTSFLLTGGWPGDAPGRPPPKHPPTMSAPPAPSFYSKLWDFATSTASTLASAVDTGRRWLGLGSDLDLTIINHEKLFLMHHLARHRIALSGCDPNVAVTVGSVDASKPHTPTDRGGGVSMRTATQLQSQYRARDMTKEEKKQYDAAYRAEMDELDRQRTQSKDERDHGVEKKKKKKKKERAERRRARAGTDGAAAAGAGSGSGFEARNWRNRSAYNPPPVQSALDDMSRLTWRSSSPRALLEFSKSKASHWETLARHFTSRQRLKLRKHRRGRRRRALSRLAQEIAPSSAHVLIFGTGFDGFKYTPKGRRVSCCNRSVRRFLMAHRRMIDACEMLTSRRCPRYVYWLRCLCCSGWWWGSGCVCWWWPAGA